MFPLWDVAVAPVLEAAMARKIVEIGALRGENTRQIIDRLGPDTELHVIDPLPDFDPAVHEREFSGQYIFHRDLSLNVLSDLAPMDAALIDGDHNWYTVYNELRMLREVARNNDAPLPLLIMHDVGWPYGHRDLYYDPTNIPEEHRRKWRRAGVAPGKIHLIPFGGGLSPTLAHAELEGGPANGVYKALEDFKAEHDKQLRTVILPIYFGLAIVAETERLRQYPELVAVLDHLESAEGRHELLKVAEDVRIEALIFQHKVFYDREQAVGRVAHRYLKLLKQDLSSSSELPIEPAELDGLQACLEEMRSGFVLGDFVFVGAERAGPALFTRAYLEAWELFGRSMLAAGTPTGWTAIQDGLVRLELTERAQELVDPPEQVALLHIDTGFDPDDSKTLAGLYERLSHGASVVVATGVDEATRSAVAELNLSSGLVSHPAPEGVGELFRRLSEDAS